jgi:hypothetical protein
MNTIYRTGTNNFGDDASLPKASDRTKPQVTGRLYIRQADGSYKTKEELEKKAKEEAASADAAKQAEQAKIRESLKATQKARSDVIDKEYKPFYEAESNYRNAVNEYNDAAKNVRSSFETLNDSFRKGNLLFEKSDLNHDLVGAAITTVDTGSGLFRIAIVPSLLLSAATAAGGAINDTLRLKVPDMNFQEVDGGGTLGQLGVDPWGNAASQFTVAVGTKGDKIPWINGQPITPSTIKPPTPSTGFLAPAASRVPRIGDLGMKVIGGLDAASAFKTYLGKLPENAVSSLEGLNKLEEIFTNEKWKEPLEFLEKNGVDLKKDIKMAKDSIENLKEKGEKVESARAERDKQYNILKKKINAAVEKAKGLYVDKN